MKEFVEKLIGRLQEATYDMEICEEQFDMNSPYFMDVDYKMVKFDDAKTIINELVEEYNNGWIACSERLPQESEPVGTLCEVVNVMLKNGIVTSGWCNRYLEKWYVLDHYHDYPLPYEYKDVIAWQPLPQPYKPQKNEWKDAVMKHFTNVE